VSTDPTDNETMQRVAARALDEEEFRDRLMRDPKSELAKEGLTLPHEVDVEVLENTSTKLHLVLPSRPEPGGKLDPDERKAFHHINRWPI
jgi:hypothetical protein